MEQKKEAKLLQGKSHEKHGEGSGGDDEGSGEENGATSQLGEVDQVDSSLDSDGDSVGGREDEQVN